MDHITIYTLRKLQSVGFSYPEYEHFLNIGMLYFYHNDEYLIGGFTEGTFSEQDKEVAQKGDWLPEAAQLLAWLRNTEFDVTVSVNEAHYSVQAFDSINASVYSGNDYTLANALANVIYKICKSKRRKYSPKATFRLPIINEKDNDLM